MNQDKIGKYISEKRKIKKDKFTITKTFLYDKEVEGYTIRVNTKTKYARIFMNT